jgi:hypothetical protein
MLKRLRCALFGHADTVVVKGPWIDNVGLGQYRVATEECKRCRAVLALRSVVTGGRWTA